MNQIPPNGPKSLTQQITSSSRQFCADFSHQSINRGPSYHKSMWTSNEDQCLREAVRQFGTNNWCVIATRVKGRTGKQCRERWAGILSPDLSKQPWCPEEDEQLQALHSKYGNRWSLISRQMKGRSTISLRNRWSWLMRHSQKIAGAVFVPLFLQTKPLIHDGDQINDDEMKLPNQEIRQKQEQNELQTEQQLPICQKNEFRPQKRIIISSVVPPNIQAFQKLNHQHLMELQQQKEARSNDDGAMPVQGFVDLCVGCVK